MLEAFIKTHGTYPDWQMLVVYVLLFPPKDPYLFVRFIVRNQDSFCIL